MVEKVTENRIESVSWMMRLMEYEEYGFTEDALDDIDILIQTVAKNYFRECMNVLGLKKEKFIFTNAEVKLLEMNGLKVNSNLITDE